MAQSTPQFRCSVSSFLEYNRLMVAITVDGQKSVCSPSTTSVHPLPQVQFAAYSSAWRDTCSNSNLGCSLFIVQDILVGHDRWQ
jgi:hypothetical protein